MASFTIAAGDKGANRKTLVAATVDTVTFTDDLKQVDVENYSTTDWISVTVDGSTPTVSGDNTYTVPPNTARTIDSVDLRNTVVKLISSGTPSYSVLKAS